MELNPAFVERTEKLFGKERFARFMQALDGEPVVSVRYNTSKQMPDDENASVPWAANGRYLSSRPVFTADPLFHAGCYYVQEASSMFIERFIEQYIDSPVRALDLCAAPGGKTTHLLSLLPKGSMLVSNEPVAQRAQVLAENVIKWGNPNSVVTRNEPADFGSFTNFFDLIVVDAPCSGEGMFRKDSGAVEQWSLSNVEQCVKRQKRILADIWPTLRPGGVLVYSTCTFNREENEDCVAWIAEELGATPLTVEADEAWGVTGALVGDMPVYRFLPGYTAGEGFFINSGALHGAWMQESGDCQFHSLVFHPRLVGGSTDSVFYQNYVRPLMENKALEGFVLSPRIPWQADACAAIESAWQACAKEMVGYEFQVRTSLSQLLCLLQSSDPDESIPNKKQQRSAARIKEMLRYVHEHFDQNIDTAQIAKSTGVSESECLRCFRTTIGTTPIQYLRQYRIQRSAQLLTDTQEPVADVARRCGFQDVSYFTKTFRELRGCAPSEYRKEHSTL